MALTIASIGKIVWVLGIVGWYVIRYPFERRARKVPISRNARSVVDTLGLACALLGLAILPGLFVATGIPQNGTYSATTGAVVFGALTLASALWVFRRSHKELGRNWSITLEIREKHKLVSSGPYALIRHPMYTAFLLMGIAQALLLANWIVGLAGLLGFAILFFMRVGKEERMMMDVFGPEYLTYMERTKRLVPFLY